MVVLTKAYRLLWENKVIKNDYKENCGDSKTYPGAGLEYFEADTLEEIEDKITELELVEEVIPLL